MSDPDDAELLRRHVAGDDEAFGVLVRRHRDRLWAVALRTLGNPEDAADAVQDALINAFRRASSFRGDASVTTWLHRIVVNACLDRIRLAASRPSVAWNDDLDPPSLGPIRAVVRRPGSTSRRPWRRCPRSSDWPSCWSIWRATRWRRPRRCSAARSGR